MFAVDVSDAVLLAIIGVVAMGVKEWFDRQRARDAAEKVAVVAAKADVASRKSEEVKEKLVVAVAVADHKIDTIHGIVNSQRTEMMAEIEELKKQLAASKEREDRVLPKDDKP